MSKHGWTWPVSVGGTTVTAELRIEDVDKDGDADVVVYVNGARLAAVQFSTLAENIRNEVRRVVKRIKKAVKK